MSDADRYAWVHETKHLTDRMLGAWPHKSGLTYLTVDAEGNVLCATTVPWSSLDRAPIGLTGVGNGGAITPRRAEKA